MATIPLSPGDKAHMYALGGVMRGGVGRAGYVAGTVFIRFDGEHIGLAPDDQAIGVIIESLSITDVLDETPNTCRFRVNGKVPKQGGEIVLTMGSKNRLDRLFAGYALNVQQRYAADRPANVQGDVAAVDYTWLLGFAKVTKQYKNQSASVVLRDLVDTFAGVNGFTAGGVVDGLAVLDEITFTNEDLPDAITRTVRRAGAYWYVDYAKDVHAFVDEVGTGAPRDLTPSHPSLAHFTKNADRTQTLTRVNVEGRGTRLLASIFAGETLLPVESIDAFPPGPLPPDVFLKISYQGAEGGAIHAAYTGTYPGGVGTLIGPGATPSSGPTLAGAGGGAVDVGVHGYAFTWQTAAGETKPSPTTSIAVTAGLATPTVAPLMLNQPSFAADPGSPPAWHAGDTVDWGYVYAFAAPYGTFSGSGNNATPISPIGSIVAVASPYWHYTPGDSAAGFEVSVPYSPDPACKIIYAVHRVNGGPWWLWHNGYGSWANRTDAGVQAPSRMFYSPQSESINYTTPETATPIRRSVVVDGIAIGPAAVTGRKLYRTKANAAPLLLVTTLPNNTATQYTDAAADATLGAAAPAGDTSGIAQPAGNVNAGATSVIVASTGPFNTGGGWAIIAGHQAIRYTGYASGALVGVPATGQGALTGPVSYNTPIEAAPLLVGVPSLGFARAITQALNEGDEVYIVVQCDDLTRQATLAQALGVPSGVREEWISDRRLSATEARARGIATLQLRELDAISVSYTCRDMLTKAGKSIRVALPAPTNVNATFKIQSVTIGNFRPFPTQQPTFTVQASSSRFSFDDLLNRIRTKE